MDKIRWNQLFTPRTLKRGYELYQRGAVEGIQHNEYAIKGSIFDDDDYYSIVYLRDGMIEDMDCSCENEDEYCEHIAALLYLLPDNILFRQRIPESVRLHFLHDGYASYFCILVRMSH